MSTTTIPSIDKRGRIAVGCVAAAMLAGIGVLIHAQPLAPITATCEASIQEGARIVQKQQSAMGMAFYSLDEWADILRGDFNHFRRGQSHWLPWQLDISCVPQPTGTTGPVTRVPVPGAPDVQAPKPAAPKEAPHLRIPRFFRIP